MTSKREDELQAVTVGALTPLEGPIVLLEYDTRWPQIFSTEAERLVSVLGERALSIEHVGSTSVPGLTAKPIIDIVLVISDSANEPAYVSDLEAAGYVLRIREPQWFEHRVLKGPAADINVHVFSAGCPEVARMLAFRDRLRENEADRERYANVKRSLAFRKWKYVQDYADAKTAAIQDILSGGLGNSAGPRRA